ncbi:MAG: DUF3800 domain-containing protein [Phycisphaerae bacterium]
MYLLYLDDSGSAPNPTESHLVLGGLSVFERQVHWISQELDQIAERIYPENPRAVEFHASEIYSGREAPWKGLNKTDRRQAIKDVLGVLANAHESTSAFACAVHKASFAGRDPMEMAFEELCNRFDLQLKRFYMVNQDRQRGLIILDKSSYETSLQRLAQQFRTDGTRWRPLRNVVDVPLFVDSKASRLVQLADHVAHAVFRRYEAGDTSYLDIILKTFDSEDGRIHGLVHLQSNDPNCPCPACMSRRLTGAEDRADSGP